MQAIVRSVFGAERVGDGRIGDGVAGVLNINRNDAGGFVLERWCGWAMQEDGDEAGDQWVVPDDGCVLAAYEVGDDVEVVFEFAVGCESVVELGLEIEGGPDVLGGFAGAEVRTSEDDGGGRFELFEVGAEGLGLDVASFFEGAVGVVPGGGFVACFGVSDDGEAHGLGHFLIKLRVGRWRGPGCVRARRRGGR